MSSKKSEVMVYPQSFTPTEKAIARSNIGAAKPLSVISYGPTGATLIFKSTDSGGGVNKAICNANLTEAGTYLLNYNFLCHANNPNQLHNMIIGLNSGDGTYMYPGASSNYVAIVPRNFYIGENEAYTSEYGNSAAGSLLLTVSTEAQALMVHFAMKEYAQSSSTQTLYIDYFSWNILALG